MKVNGRFHGSADAAVCCGGKCGDEDFYIVVTDSESGEFVYAEGPFEGAAGREMASDRMGMFTTEYPDDVVTMMRVPEAKEKYPSLVADEGWFGDPAYGAFDALIVGVMPPVGMDCVCFHVTLATVVSCAGMSVPRFCAWVKRAMDALFVEVDKLPMGGKLLKVERVEGPDMSIDEFGMRMWTGLELCVDKSVTVEDVAVAFRTLPFCSVIACGDGEIDE
jgi:hypothetical protein